MANSDYLSDRQIDKLNKESDGVKLPDPASNIYDNVYTKQSIVTSTDMFSNESKMSDVTLNSGASAADVGRYLDAIQVEQYIPLELTLASDGFSGYEATKTANFKDQTKPRAPAALVYLKTGEGEDAIYNLLPYLKIDSTTLFVTQYHKFLCRKNYIEIQTYGDAAQTFNYDIYLLKDKFAQFRN